MLVSQLDTNRWKWYVEKVTLFTSLTCCLLFHDITSQLQFLYSVFLHFLQMWMNILFHFWLLNMKIHLWDLNNNEKLTELILKKSFWVFLTKRKKKEGSFADQEFDPVCFRHKKREAISLNSSLLYNNKHSDGLLKQNNTTPWPL